MRLAGHRQENLQTTGFSSFSLTPKGAERQLEHQTLGQGMARLERNEVLAPTHVHALWEFER